MMKRLLFLFVLLMGMQTVFAFDTNELFGFKKQLLSEGYQQYVGKIFLFRKSCGTAESLKNFGIKLGSSAYLAPYVITKVSVKSYVIEVNIRKSFHYRRITVEAIQNTSNRPVKFSCYEFASKDMKYLTENEWRANIDNLPIVFMVPYSDFKREVLNDTIYHPFVKDTYRISDVQIETFNETDEKASIVLTVRNNRTNELRFVRYDKREKETFLKELEGAYKTVLYKVEKPENPAIKYGKTRVVEEEGIEKYTYVDNVIELVVANSEKDFSVILKNVDSHSIKIIWDEASYVDNLGLTSKVIHGETKFLEKEHSQPPTTVLSGAKLVDFICPSSNIKFDIEKNIWQVAPLFPTEFMLEDLGEVKLMLPIQIEDVVNEYVFVFKVYYDFAHPELLQGSDFEKPKPWFFEV